MPDESDSKATSAGSSMLDSKCSTRCSTRQAASGSSHWAAAHHDLDRCAGEILGTSWGSKETVVPGAKDTSPPSGATSPLRIRIRVVLPAPLRPSRPILCPASIWQETSSSKRRTAKPDAKLLDADLSHGGKRAGPERGCPRGRLGDVASFKCHSIGLPSNAIAKTKPRRDRASCPDFDKGQPGGERWAALPRISGYKGRRSRALPSPAIPQDPDNARR